MTANELGRCHGLPREVVRSLPAHKATRLIGRGTERLTIQAVGEYLSDYVGPVAPAHVQPAPMPASCVYASSTFQAWTCLPARLITHCEMAKRLTERELTHGAKVSIEAPGNAVAPRRDLDRWLTVV
jgi:hypothetical protein